MEGYADQKFRNSNVTKLQLFRECLALNLDEDSVKLISSRCALGYHKDARTTLEYGLDLILGWLSEDLLIQNLKHRGHDVRLNGADREREFLLRGEINTNADITYTVNTVSRPFEIVISWTDYWTKEDKWDLRSSKYNRLTKSGNESLCLGLEVPTKLGFLIDMKYPPSNFIENANMRWGSKPVYSLGGLNRVMNSFQEVLDGLSKFGSN